MKSPGDYIRDALASKNWGQDDLARVLGRPPSRVNEMIQGKAPISLEMAVALSAALGDSPADWMQRDADFRLSHTSTEAEDVRKKAALYDLAPVRDMEKRGWIRKTTTAAELENELKSFFGVKELTPAPSIAAIARRTGGSEEAQELTPAQRAWCFRAKALASDQIVSPYDPNRFEECIREIRPLAAFAPETRKVAKILSKHGIRFVIVEPLAGAKIDGAAFWINESPAVAVSVRYDRIDAFWFTLCHELSHVRHRDPLSIDTALIGEDALPSAMKLAFEERADIEAAKMLIPPDKIESFILRVAPLYSKEKIIQFAHVIKVHPGIIVGQLQHRGQIGYQANRDMLVKVRSHATSGAIVDGWGHTVN